MASEETRQKFGQLPPEMLDFTILKTSGALAPRLARLTVPGRKPILTPAFLGNTSRGTIPHISQDNFKQCPDINGVYVALEDFIEKYPKMTPPVFEYAVPDPLRRFISLPEDTLMVLGARRNPPIASPVSNTNTDVALLTSVGFKSMSSEYYAAAARKLQPDIVVGLADIPFGQEIVGLRRKDKMSDRTESWMRDLLAKRASMDATEKRFNIFAPMLPIDKDLQSWYLEHLVDTMLDKINGIAIYDAYLLDDLPEETQHLPRLSFHIPASPHEVLRQISLGVDILTIPFIADATDAGIALSFTFPAPKTQDPEAGASQRQSLGIDMWSASHATSLSPLSSPCSCIACTRHHRAYIQHLLSAKEMLGWVLLQHHNHAILSSFFAGIRASLHAGTFKQDVQGFEAFYMPHLPAKTGQGPRVRGYQFKAEEHGRLERKNPKAYRRDLEGVTGLVVGEGIGGEKRMEKGDVVDEEALVGLVGVEGVQAAVGVGEGEG